MTTRRPKSKLKSKPKIKPPKPNHSPLIEWSAEVLQLAPVTVEHKIAGPRR